LSVGIALTADVLTRLMEFYPPAGGKVEELRLRDDVKGREAFQEVSYAMWNDRSFHIGVERELAAGLTSD